jgi:hypothetical protein
MGSYRRSIAVHITRKSGRLCGRPAATVSPGAPVCAGTEAASLHTRLLRCALLLAVCGAADTAAAAGNGALAAAIPAIEATIGRSGAQVVRLGDPLLIKNEFHSLVGDSIPPGSGGRLGAGTLSSGWTDPHAGTAQRAHDHREQQPRHESPHGEARHRAYPRGRRGARRGWHERHPRSRGYAGLSAGAQQHHHGAGATQAHGSARHGSRSRSGFLPRDGRGARAPELHEDIPAGLRRG